MAKQPRLVADLADVFSLSAATGCGGFSGNQRLRATAAKEQYDPRPAREGF
jgi:hypothetical protein